MTSANAAVVAAYLTDATPEAQRAQRFGLLGAMFGAASRADPRDRLPVPRHRGRVRRALVAAGRRRPALTAATIGLSLGAFGVCQAVAQATLPGPAGRRLGERAALIVGCVGVSCALTGQAVAVTSCVVVALMPLFALGSIGVPALQAAAER